MASHTVEWSVGAFILMGFACAVALAFASTGLKDQLLGEHYAVTARFSNAGDLKVGAPVKTAGVRIGEVSGIRLDPQSYEAVATLRIARDAGELPGDSSAAIYTSGLLGERYVGISPGGDPLPLADGDEILLTQSAVVLEELIGKYVFGGAGAAAGAPGGEQGAVPQAAPAAADSEDDAGADAPAHTEDGR